MEKITCNQNITKGDQLNTWALGLGIAPAVLVTVKTAFSANDVVAVVIASSSGINPFRMLSTGNVGSFVASATYNCQIAEGDELYVFRLARA